MTQELLTDQTSSIDHNRYSSTQLRIIGTDDLREMFITAVKGENTEMRNFLSEMITKYEQGYKKQEFYSALVAFKTQLKSIPRNKQAVVKSAQADKVSYSYWYAGLGIMLEYVTPPLAKEGFSLRFTTQERSDGLTEIICTLTHHNGYSIEDRVTVHTKSSSTKGPDNSLQTRESALTYAKRSLLSNILGIAPQDDDDGNAHNKNPDVNTEITENTNHSGEHDNGPFASENSKLDDGIDQPLLEEFKQMIDQAQSVQDLNRIHMKRAKLKRSATKDKIFSLIGARYRDLKCVFVKYSELRQGGYFIGEGQEEIHQISDLKALRKIYPKVKDDILLLEVWNIRLSEILPQSIGTATSCTTLKGIMDDFFVLLPKNTEAYNRLLTMLNKKKIQLEQSLEIVAHL